MTLPSLLDTALWLTEGPEDDAARKFLYKDYLRELSNPEDLVTVAVDKLAIKVYVAMHDDRSEDKLERDMADAGHDRRKFWELSLIATVRIARLSGTIQHYAETQRSPC